MEYFDEKLTEEKADKVGTERELPPSLELDVMIYIDYTAC